MKTNDSLLQNDSQPNRWLMSPIVPLTTTDKLAEHHRIVKLLEEKIRKHLSWSLDRVHVRGDSLSSISDSSAAVPDIWVETISRRPVQQKQVVETSLIISLLDNIDEEAKQDSLCRLLSNESLRELVVVDLSNSILEVHRRDQDVWIETRYESNSIVKIETIGMHLDWDDILGNKFVADNVANQNKVTEISEQPKPNGTKGINGPKAQIGKQVPYRSPIQNMESGRGYLIRLTEELSYQSPLMITNMAGSRIKGIDNEDVLDKLAPILRYSPDELKKHFYRSVNGSGNYRLRSFFGQSISAYYLNLHLPRLCPACISELPVCTGLWDINMVTVCPTHGCELIDTCPKCDKPLVWHRCKISQCLCGFDLCNVRTNTASTITTELTSVIHHAAQSSSNVKRKELKSRFPVELLALSLPSLLKVIRYIGCAFHPMSKNKGLSSYRRNDLRERLEIVKTAGKILSQWPQNYWQKLRIANNTYEVENTSEKNILQAFGNHYHQLFEEFGNAEFNFLRDAFEQYLNDEWGGLIRTTHLSNSSSISPRWLSPHQASNLTDGLGKKALRKLYSEGAIKGIEKQFQSTGHRSIWLDRNSVEKWIKESTKWMPLKTAERLLGLNLPCILALGEAGLFNYKKGRVLGCGKRTWIFEADSVNRIIGAFECHHLHVEEYEKKTSSRIALQHALQDFLNLDKGLPQVISAVMAGELVPVARAGTFFGIRDYIFDTQQLRKFRSMESTAHGIGYLNIGEVIRLLGVHRNVVKSLFDGGFISTPTYTGKGEERLVSAEEVQLFKDKYVFAKELGSQIGTSANWVVRHLAKIGIEAQVLKLGSGYQSIFYENGLLAEIRMPPSKDERITKLNTLLRSLQPAQEKQLQNELTTMRLTAKQVRALPSFFKDIPDPRKAAFRHHKLSAVLGIVAGANLCGVQGANSVAEWARDLSPKDLERFGCHRDKDHIYIPSRSLISDLLRRVDRIKFDQALERCIAANRKEEQATIVKI